MLKDIFTTGMMQAIEEARIPCKLRIMIGKTKGKRLLIRGLVWRWLGPEVYIVCDLLNPNGDLLFHVGAFNIMGGDEIIIGDMFAGLKLVAISK